VGAPPELLELELLPAEPLLKPPPPAVLPELLLSRAGAGRAARSRGVPAAPIEDVEEVEGV
jgi:hypothetical protein